MTVRFVYFDLGNVLVAFDPEIACGNVARLFHVPVDLARSVVYTSGRQAALERGELSGEAFASEVRSAFAAERDPALCGPTQDGPTQDGPTQDGPTHGPTQDGPKHDRPTQLDLPPIDPDSVTTGALLDAISDMFTPIDSMRHTIANVRRLGLGVGILSNTCHAHWDWIARQRYPVMTGPFDAAVLSFQVGAMKPDAAIYDAAERVAGVAPDEILFLDDRPENVAAATGRGWRAAECFGGEPAVRALSSHGLL